MAIDGDLEALCRALEADPKDNHVKQQYLSALIRAGQQDKVKSLISEGFMCEYRWGDLNETALDTIRSCDDCHKNVYYAHDVDALGNLVSQGHCIAANESVLMDYVDTLVTPASKDLKTLNGHPCAFSDKLPLYNKMQPPAAPSIFSLISATVAMEFRVYPLKERGPVLVLAAAAPLKDSKIIQLKRVLGREITFEIVEMADVDANLMLRYGPPMPPPTMMLAGAPPPPPRP
ncbi:MAG: hypothetical protein P1V97_32455 [Planctomycetota bacterium]|nr:hypothetical protein [Planctomycetota bacterium]